MLREDILSLQLFFLLLVVGGGGRERSLIFYQRGDFQQMKLPDNSRVYSGEIPFCMSRDKKIFCRQGTTTEGNIYLSRMFKNLIN